MTVKKQKNRGKVNKIFTAIPVNAFTLKISKLQTLLFLPHQIQSKLTGGGGSDGRKEVGKGRKVEVRHCSEPRNPGMRKRKREKSNKDAL